MARTLQIKYKATTGAGSLLSRGEFAYNGSDDTLYFGDGSSSIILFTDVSAGQAADSAKLNGIEGANYLRSDESDDFNGVLSIKAAAGQLRIYETDAADPNDFFLLQRADEVFNIYSWDDNPGAYTLGLAIKMDGSVGIGTTDPQSHLHVYGASTQQVKVETTANSVVGLAINSLAGNWSVGLGKVTNDEFDIYDESASASRLHIDDTGNVGIGETNPIRKIHVVADGAPVARFERDTNDGTVIEIRDFNNNNIGTIGTDNGDITFDTTGNFISNGSNVLTTADEGAGNGLDADQLDGQEGSYYLDCGNFTGTLDNARLAASVILESDIDDTPVDAATDAPISSNWAYDHVAASDPHTGYMLESNIGTGADNYLVLNGSAQIPAVSGALLTNLNASNLASGTVATARLDSTVVLESDVDDSPASGATTDPISSNWAYTHANAADPHTGYMLESNIGTGANNYLQLNGSAQIPAVDGSLLTGITVDFASSSAEIDSGDDLDSLSDGIYNWDNDNPSNSPGDYAVAFQLSDPNQKIQLAFGGTTPGFLAYRRADSGTFYDWKYAVTDTSGVGLKQKVVEIGDWNMSTTEQKTVAHGLTLSKIVGMRAVIRNDSDNARFTIPRCDSSDYTVFSGNIVGVTSTYVELKRSSGGDFNSSDFDSTSYNRGWIIIDYID